MDSDRLGKLVQDYSGKLGMEKIDDFEDWYSQRFPNSDGPSAETPKAVLVGLGVDDRARRIVSFLANSTIDIQLLTFHAFLNGDQLLLARQVETIPPVPRQVRDRPTSQSKEINLLILTEQAASLGVTEFLGQVTEFLKDNFPAYAWPGKTSYTFYLTERTEQGKPSQRAYVSLYLDTKTRNSLKLIFIPRATEVAPEALAKLYERFPKITSKNMKTNQVEVSLSPSQWQAFSGELAGVLTAIMDGWKKKTTTSLAEAQSDATGPYNERGA